ncbi:hypothetical protein FRB94_001229 [Tulasnella sp. JGI-2019a]|nr:hypothetical protein FRB93_007881 [Tulasnella sp. JGI-2019a]KAG9013667.1 hypothetical protein FRB94_001229 [Tulasnella sp. JGI-2019a]KAG9028134.1 hypothetical protein FRB95_006818 [Tulasnella sp. JGI-2019a]
MAAYSGSLASKKKQDLQDLASDLGIDTSGTKDDLQERIKRHLAEHQELAQDPRFSGLYSRKKPANRQPSMSINENVEPSGQVVQRPHTRQSQAVTVFPVTNESEIPDVQQAEERIAEEAVAIAPQSPTRSIIEFVSKKTQEVLAATDPDAVVEVVREKGRVAGQEVNKGTTWLKRFLSNANNITSLTIVAELLYILYTVIPWQYYQIPLNAPYTTRYDGISPVTIMPEDPPLVSTRIASIPYIPHTFLTQPTIYSTLILWALPTLLIPLCFGGLVSFKPGHAWSASGQDALTAAIVRLACVFAGDWGLDWSNELGISQKWRILSASLAGAFSLAEAIGGRAPLPPVVDTPAVESETEE